MVLTTLPSRADMKEPVPMAISTHHLRSMFFGMKTSFGNGYWVSGSRYPVISELVDYNRDSGPWLLGAGRCEHVQPALRHRHLALYRLRMTLQTISSVLNRKTSLFAKLKEKASILNREVYALVIAAMIARVPWYARVFMGLVLAYAFSPIDLIPDFIPVLGYLDDLVIVPLGIALSLKMIPVQVMTEARQKAEEALRQGKPSSRVGAILIIAIWLIMLVVVIGLLARAARMVHCEPGMHNWLINDINGFTLRFPGVKTGLNPMLIGLALPSIFPEEIDDQFRCY